MEKVTLEQLAAQLGLSKSTVSKALSGASDVRPATRQRVLRQAALAGYRVRPRGPARQGELVAFLHGRSYAEAQRFGYEVLLGFQTAATGANYTVRVVMVEEKDPLRSCYREEMRHAAGCFCIGFDLSGFPPEEFDRVGRPAVLLDSWNASALTAQLGTDDQVGMNEVMLYLTRQGHQRVAFVGGEADSQVTAARRAAFEAAARLYGRQTEGLCAYASFYGDYDPALLLQLLEKGATALVCCSDLIALAAVHKLQNAGVQVPEQASVVGYDGIPIAAYASPALTTVAQDGLQLGKSAFLLLRQLTRGLAVSRLALRPALVLRSSAGPAPTPAPAPAPDPGPALQPGRGAAGGPP